MQDREPTIRSRELGEGLRRAMQNAGLTGKDVARLLDLSPVDLRQAQRYRGAGVGLPGGLPGAERGA